MFKEYIKYNGMVYEVRSRYSNLIAYIDPRTKQVKTIGTNGVIACDAKGTPLEDVTSTPVPESKPAGLELKVGTPVPPSPKVEYHKVSFKNNSDVTSKELSGSSSSDSGNSNEETEKYNLNTLNEGDDAAIRKVARAVPGLAYKTLKKIIELRPLNGYENVEHLQELTGGEIPRNLKWNTIDSYLEW